jgi:amino acid adenylation domain-containing protein
MPIARESEAMAEMSAELFLRSLRGLAVELRARDGKLALSAPPGVVTAEMQAELRRRKPELLELLTAEAAERVAPLTFAQQRLWLIDRFSPENTAYNIPQAWFVEDAIDVEALRVALHRLLERHEALRTRIELRDGTAVQVVQPQAEAPVAVIDLRATEPELLEAEIQAHLLRSGRTPFALHQAPLIRFQVLMLPGRRTLVAYDVHHIVADQWSMDILKRDLAALYFEALQGIPAQLPVLPITYADVAQRERSEATARVHAEQLDYWRGRLEGMPTVLELPFRRAGAEEEEYAGATLTMRLDERPSNELRQLAARNQTTLYMVMLGAFATLLYRYTGQGDLCVGTPLTGRKLREEEELIGLFVNMLPLRCGVDPAMGFQQMLKLMSGQVLADIEHGDLPFQKLVMELHPHRSLTHTPLFQVMFGFTPRPADRDQDQEQALEETFLGVAKFDLTLQVVERVRGLDLYIEYRTDLYAKADMEQFGRHFARLAQSIVDAPDAPVATLPLLTEEDHAAFARWNDTALDFDRTATLIDLFDRQVEVTPEATALLCGDVELSYRELSERADVLADALRERGAVPESFVALCLERSAELIVTMLAILRTGAAYLPLDPKYPLERLKYMLEDSGSRILVTQRGELSEELQAHCEEVDVLYAQDVLSAQRVTQTEARTGAAKAAAHAENAAYLIYTSGSTGKPKGVVIEHRNAAALIAWARTQFDAKALRGMLASTSVCFDLSVFEIFLPLATGNAIVLMQDVLALAASPLRDRVTLVNTVPSAMSALLQAGLPKSVNTVCMAGEFLPSELVERVYRAGVERVFDLYGPTETTTYSTCVLRRSGEPATIGGPIANTRIYLLDAECKAVPPGAAGEIFIGGEGVARGYLHRPELTAERFVALPEVESQGRLYRTGDLARQMQDGLLVFLGRRDHQIKLRGHRIELGEVEAALREVTGIAEVAAVVQAREPGDTLVAFVEAASSEADGTRTDETRTDRTRGWVDALRKRLPAVMVPAAIVGLRTMPRTPNGKIDRQALRQQKDLVPQAAETRNSAQDGARDLLEQWLANIWSHRLGVADVTRDAHFFEDLGGHSLAAFEIFAEIEARLGVAMLLATLFKAPTVAQLAAAVRRLKWKEPKHLRLLAQGKGSAQVVYLLGSLSSAGQEALAAGNVRTMSVGAEEAMNEAAHVGAWAAEMAAVEASRPAVSLLARRADEAIVRRLQAELMAVGFTSVSVQLQ